MIEFLLSDFINLTEDNKSFIRKNCNMIVYRFYFEDEGLSYVGVTRSLINRLYNWMYGHITLMNNRKVDKELYNLMRSSDPNKVHFYVEKKCTDLVDLSDSEIETISKYDSYNNGLNRTRGGFIKCIWVTDGTSRMRVPRLRVPDGYYPVDKDEARITKKSINNRVSSNKSGKKRSYVRPYVKRIVVNNGESIKGVKESQVDEFLREGYVLGGSSVMATLKGKVFVYKTSSEDRILIDESELDKYLSMGYKKR